MAQHKPLTEMAIRNLKVKDGQKSTKLFDAPCFYIEAFQNGSKLWRLAYYYHGKKNTCSLGSYPALSLKDARAKRDEVKALLERGIDPNAHKREVKAAEERQRKEAALTFEAVAMEWLGTRTRVTEKTNTQVLDRMKNHLFPRIGAISIARLSRADVLRALKEVEDQGTIDLAHRLLGLVGQVCRFGLVCDYCQYDVTSGISQALKAVPPVKHRAAIVDNKEIGLLLRAIDESGCSIPVKYALKIVPYVFVRSTELRCARWEEFNIEKREWVIPSERTKSRRPHFVPLAGQGGARVQVLHKHTGNSPLLFPGNVRPEQAVSDASLRLALRRMGYDKDEMTVHGFRGTASTLLNEQGFRPDVIELQLSHAEKSSVRRAYNHAEYRDERIEMMQKWADYLDTLREQAIN